MKPYYFALLTALVWGLVPAFEKMGLAKLSPQAGIFVRCLSVSFGSLILLSIKPSIWTELSKAPLKNIGLIVFGGFTANFLGQLLFYNALKNGEASRVVPLAGAYPLVSFLIGIIFLGEKITLAKAGGIALILSGIFLLK